MPTKRIFYMTIAVVTLAFPARQTVRQWCRKQIGTHPEGTVLNAIGEVGITIL